MKTILIEFLNYIINSAIRWLSDGWNEYLKNAEHDKEVFLAKSILYPLLIIFGSIALYGAVALYWKIVLFVLVFWGLISVLRCYLAKHHKGKNIIPPETDNPPPNAPYLVKPDGK